MKKFRAKTALFLIPLALALLQGGGALGAEAKYKLVPNGVRYTSSVHLSPHTIRTREEELLQKVLPRVTFDCFGKTGYFSDSEFQCEVFHYCKSNGVRNTFHCPLNSIFNQLSMLCEEKTEFNKRLCNEGSVTTKANLWTPLKASAPTKPGSFFATNSSKHKSTDTDKDIKEKNRVAFQHLMSVILKSDNQNVSKTTSYESTTQSSQSNSSLIATMVTKSPNHTVDSDKIITATISVAPNDGINYGDVIHENISEKSKDVVLGQSDSGTKKKTGIMVPLDRQQKPRQHRRKGRVLDLQRSASETITKIYTEDMVAQEGATTTTAPSQTTSTLDNYAKSKPQSLFNVSSDRARNKENRKRRRNNRRRKIAKLEAGASTDIQYEGISEIKNTSTSPEPDKARFHRRKTLLSEKEGNPGDGENWQGLISPQEKKGNHFKVQSHYESKRTNDSVSEDSNRNPYFRKTNGDKNDNNYGTRNPSNENSDHLLHYGGNVGSMGPTDYFGDQEFPKASEEWTSEENHSVEVPSEKNRIRKKKKKSSRHAIKKRPLHTDSSWANDSQEDYENPTISSETKVSLPSLLSSTQEELKSVADLDIGEDEFRTKIPYKDHYYPEIQELADLEKNRWKIGDYKDRNKKINVGDSMDKSRENVKPDFLMNHESQEKSSQTMNTVKTSVKQLPKHTAAHQHLSKLMNEFFSMSTQNPPGLNVKSVQTGANIHIPKYRIPDEDIYKADSVAEPVDDLPQEVLDVVEFIAEQQAMKKEEPQPDYTKHQIIKVNTNSKVELSAEDLAEIFSNKKPSKFSSPIESMQGRIKEMLFVPGENDNSDDDEQEFKEIAELASFTSERIEPLLKTVFSKEKSIQVVPYQNAVPLQQKSPSMSLSDTIPLRFIYRKNFQQPKPTSQSLVKPPSQKPSFKIIRARLPQPKLQVIHNNQMMSSPNSQFVILRPPSLVPPHPPPIMPNPLPSMLHYSRLPLIRPLMRSPFQFRSRRRRRSLVSRFKRQVSYNPNNNPFYNPFFKTFSPNFTPHFQQFRNVFGSPSSVLLNTAGSHTFPFTFPTVRAPKLPKPLQPNFVPPHQPLRHPHQTSHQTMVVNDIPFPVHVDGQPPLIPQHSQLRSARPLSQPFPQHLNPAANGIRRPPQIHQPPLINNHFLKPVPIKNDGILGAPFPLNIRPSTLPQRPTIPNPRSPFLPLIPSNLHPRSPVHNFKPPLPKLPPVPGNFADHILPLALPVSRAPQKPIQQGPSGHAKPLVYSPYSAVKPIPHIIRNQLIGHLNSFPGMGKPQSELRDSFNPSFPGLLMHSGYKPPKTSKPQIKHNNTTNRNNNPKNIYSSQPEPPAGYLEVTYKKNVGRTPPKPTGTYDIRHSSTLPSRKKEKPFGMPQIITPPLPPPRSKPKPLETHNPRPIPIYSYTSSYTTVPSVITKPKRKRPSRRRRPKPRPSASYSPPPKPQPPVSPTPPPPQQIPPPPADYTPRPFYKPEEISNSIQPMKVESQSGNNKQQNLFPPAGYYGRDQLGQFFENIKKNEQRAVSVSSSHAPEKSFMNSASLSTASSSKEDIELDESGDQPVFGARIRPKSRRQNSDSQRSSQTQRKETRAKQTPQIPSRDFQIPSAATNTYIEPNRPRNSPPQPPRRRKPPKPQRPTEKSTSESASIPSEIKYPKPVTPSPGFFNVPGGLGNVVDPSAQLQPGGNVPRDMFGIPIPFAEQNIFTDLRPADPNHRDFFSVPGHVARQQLASLQKDRPQSFLPPSPKEPPSPKDLSGPSLSNSNPEGRPKRRKRIKVKGRAKVPQNNAPRTIPSFTEKSITEAELRGISGGSSTFHEKTTLPSTTRASQKPTSMPRYVSERRYIETARKVNLPPTLQEVSKSLLEGKLDIKKLNATISTSVSVSAGNKPRSSENEPRKVFSSKNGGLAVVKNGPRQRKRFKPPKISTMTKDSETSRENAIKSDEKLQIASSVIDIIKATSESEMRQTTTDPSMQFASSKLSMTWVPKPDNMNVRTF